MGLLEDALRATFAEQVRTPPVADDAAGRAIRGAGRVRRRRAAAGTLAVVVSVALAGVGVAVTWGGPSRYGPASGPPVTVPDQPRPVDVWKGNQIVTSDDRTISLEHLPTVIRVTRVDDGWLVITSGSRRQPSTAGRSPGAPRAAYRWATGPAPS
jgi:hypothetical protein